MWARVHRWLAIVLVGLLVVWSITGLLFHLKPGWNRAYDQLSAERRESPLVLEQLVAPAALREQLGPDPVGRLELFETVLGPFYRASTKAGPRLIDARTGTVRVLDIAEASKLALDAVSRSQYRDDYGELASSTAEDKTVRLTFAGGPIVEVGRNDARISQHGPDTDRIDWLYRVHYLQWTGNRTLDQLLAIFGLVLIWAVMIPGLVLFVRRIRKR